MHSVTFIPTLSLVRLTDVLVYSSPVLTLWQPVIWIGLSWVLAQWRTMLKTASHQSTGHWWHVIVSSRLLLKHWAHLVRRHALSFRILDGASQLSLPSLARSSSWCRDWAWHYSAVMLPAFWGLSGHLWGLMRLWDFLFIGISVTYITSFVSLIFTYLQCIPNRTD